MIDVWSHKTPSILTDAALSRMHAISDTAGPLILEHRHYRASRAPTRLIFETSEQAEAYIRENGVPGDSFWIWSYEDVCSADNVAISGKVPRPDGTTPEGGAY